MYFIFDALTLGKRMDFSIKYNVIAKCIYEPRPVISNNVAFS